MGSSRQEYWSGLPISSPGDLPFTGIKQGLLHYRQILYHLSHQTKFIDLYKVKKTWYISQEVYMNCCGASPVAQTVKNLPAVQEICLQSLGWEDTLKKGMIAHSSILAWRIPGQRSLASYSPWGCKNQTWLSDFTTTTTTLHFRKIFLVLLFIDWSEKKLKNERIKRKLARIGN